MFVNKRVEQTISRFNIINLWESRLPIALQPLASKIISETSNENPELRRKGILKRPYTEIERYVADMLIGTGEMVNVCEQMGFAVELLSGFRTRKMMDGLCLTRKDYIVYQLENYYIRVNMIMDRALQLVNVAFRLGINVRKVTFKGSVEHKAICQTKVCGCLTALATTIDQSRDIRHRIVHYNSYSDKEIKRIEAYYFFVKMQTHGDDKFKKKTAEIVTDDYHFYKRLTDEDIKKRKHDLRINNQRIFAQVNELFTELLIVFETEYAKFQEKCA